MSRQPSLPVIPPNAASKPDLLGECNDQRRPVGEFMATFCAHCRNGGCRNAQWAGSKWEARIATQVERLFGTPERFLPVDSPLVREVNARGEFKPVAAPLVLNSPLTDPWSVPAGPVRAPSVGTPEAPVAEALARAVEAPPNPAPTTAPTPPLGSPAGPARPPQHPPAVPTRFYNTEFPAEGVMLDGGPPLAAPQLASALPTAPHDPWAVDTRKVAVGARVRMGGK